MAPNSASKRRNSKPIKSEKSSDPSSKMVVAVTSNMIENLGLIYHQPGTLGHSHTVGPNAEQDRILGLEGLVRMIQAM
jgi:hypothetical protein